MYSPYPLADLLGLLFGAPWKGSQSSNLEIHFLTLRRDHFRTSRMMHKDHVSRIADGRDEEWIDFGYLPHYFDPALLESGLRAVEDGTADVCTVMVTHTGGNTDGGPVHAVIKDEQLEIKRVAPDKFEIHLVKGGRTSETYRPVSTE
jgi:hypothetical protein